MGGITFLQETHLNKEEHRILEKLASVQVFASSHSTAKRGLAILIQKHNPFTAEKNLRR